MLKEKENLSVKCNFANATYVLDKTYQTKRHLAFNIIAKSQQKATLTPEQISMQCEN